MQQQWEELSAEATETQKRNAEKIENESERIVQAVKLGERLWTQEGNVPARPGPLAPCKILGVSLALGKPSVPLPV